jgi:hypothetical protein
MNGPASRALQRIDDPRITVACVGAPVSFEDELRNRSLSPLSLSGENIDAVRQATTDFGSCRAVVVFAGPMVNNSAEQQRLAKLISAVKDAAFRDALPIAVLVDGDSDDVARAFQILDTTSFQSSVYSFAQRGIVLNRLLEYQPGPAWRDISVKDSMGAEDKFLIQRAFSDCNSIELQKLASGKSVYRVDARRLPEPQPVPFLVKVDQRDKIEKERGNIEALCADRVPFPFVPPMISQRSASGEKRSALVSHFVDRATLLADYAGKNNLNRVILSIFDDALRVWRSNPTKRQYKIGHYALREKRITSESADDYDSAYNAARQNGAITAPSELLKKLRKLPAIEVNEVCSHGDLHLRNVFVRQSGEVVLIDFLRSGGAPSSRDPAELECAIALDPALGDAISFEKLEAVYAAPLLPAQSQTHANDHRLDAICQVRRQMGSIVGDVEYQIMVAAHLLWWACRSRRNPAAYRLAERLIVDAETHL